MRRYMTSPAGREVFRRTYDEALRVALASGTRPEPMIVDPIPPGWQQASVAGPDHGRWLEQVTAAYGDLKPSMLQDFERGRRTEIDFINGYVADVGRRLGVPVPLNEAVTALVHRIEQRLSAPHLDRLSELHG